MNIYNGSVMKAIYLLDDKSYDLIYGQEERRQLSELLDFVLPQLNKDSVYKAPLEKLAGVEVVVGGWGMPRMTPELLGILPSLKFIFYGAGSIKGFATDEMWGMGVRVASAWAANAVPVAELAFAEIILSLKNFWAASARYKSSRGEKKFPTPAGAYKSTVGLVSLGMIGRLVVEKLKTLDVKIIAYDPFVTDEDASRLGCEIVGLDELFRRSDAISCHTPWLKETEKMITGRHFETMKAASTFINTARGAVVDEPAMVEVLRKRPDIHAVLDVTWPEPPPKDSPLYELPNVVLSPHIAGSMGAECRRMGQYMIEEIRKYQKGAKLEYEITRETSAKLA